MTAIATRPAATVIDHEFVAVFLGQMPDDQVRDDLAADFRKHAARLADLRRRPGVIGERTAEVLRDLTDAQGSQRKALINEQGALTTELQVLPHEIEAVAGRYVAALSAWVGYVYKQARVAHDSAVDELNPLRREYRTMQERLEYREQWKSRDGDVDRDAMDRQRQELGRRTTPLEERRQAAGNCARYVNGVLQRHFGDECRDGQPYAPGVARWIAGIRRSVETQ